MAARVLYKENGVLSAYHLHPAAPSTSTNIERCVEIFEFSSLQTSHHYLHPLELFSMILSHPCRTVNNFLCREGKGFKNAFKGHRIFVSENQNFIRKLRYQIGEYLAQNFKGCPIEE
jgi:hypothetical protein